MRLLTIFMVTLLAAFAIACAPAATSAPAPTPAPQITLTPEILSHVLKVVADPEGAAKFVFNPLPIGQGLFVHGRTVTIDVLLQPGWRIDKWVGPVFETAGERAKIKMDSSQSVVVRLVPASAQLASPSPTRALASPTKPVVAPSPTSTATAVPPASPRAAVVPLSTTIPPPKTKVFDGAAPPVGSAEFRGHYYLTFRQRMTWEKAAAYAESLGGHLVTISDEVENRFVADLVIDKGLPRTFLIGLSDKVQEGRFLWVTGEPFIYSNWHSGEPNNGGNEDYVTMDLGIRYDWNDVAAHESRPFVVEFEPTPVPMATLTPTPVPTPTQSPGATVPIRAAILKIECGPEFKLRVHISIKSEAGIASFSLWSTWGSQGRVERNFVPPYPTAIEEVVTHDEEYSDTIDRHHQIGLKVVSPGVADPFLTYRFEPDDRCPGHFFRSSSADPVTPPPNVPSGGLIRGATISGRVVDVDTGLPIANVRMRADDPATRRGPRADTGLDGRYSLSGIGPGVYIVSADGVANGYIVEIYDDKYASEDAARFAVTGTEVIEGIDFGLKQGATISGRVVDAVTGLPIVNMDVRAAPVDGGPDISWGETGTDGRYTLKGIPDGLVEVFVVGQGYIRMSKTVMVRDGQDLTGIDF